MFKISCNTHAKVGGKITKINFVKKEGKLLKFDTLEAADKFAVRLTMAESNPRITYQVI